MNTSLHSERLKRSARRSFIIKCCGQESCSQGTKERFEMRQDSKRKVQEEAEFVNGMQYAKPKKRRRKKPQQNTADLSSLRAFAVFTDGSIHISCAGCPAGWPDMLTVYPEIEIGIPVTCSNCPYNWPGALNLLGVGGDPSWSQGGGFQRGFDGSEKGFGFNSFINFDTGSNFGSGFQPLPPDQSGGGFNFNNGEENVFETTTDFTLRMTTSKNRSNKSTPKQIKTTTAKSTEESNDSTEAPTATEATDIAEEDSPSDAEEEEQEEEE
jgi:hypothetical protein